MCNTGAIVQCAYLRISLCILCSIYPAQYESRYLIEHRSCTTGILMCISHPQYKTVLPIPCRTQIGRKLYFSHIVSNSHAHQTTISPPLCISPALGKQQYLTLSTLPVDTKCMHHKFVPRQSHCNNAQQATEFTHFSSAPVQQALACTNMEHAGF